MTTFLSYQNKGVTALIREDQLAAHNMVVSQKLDPAFSGLSIFTFATQDNWNSWLEYMVQSEISAYPYFTGTLGFMTFLMRGHEVKPASMLYVPFSNNRELHNDAGGRWERQFRTTPMEVFEAFELSRLRPPALVAHT